VNSIQTYDWPSHTEGGSRCANPAEFERFWNVSVNIDESVECICSTQQGTGGAPLYVCAKK